MHISNEQREERFQNAPKYVQHLYSSSESGEYLYSVFQKHSLPDDVYKTYARTIGDVMLGFYSISELPSLLQQNTGVSEERASAITADLQQLLAPLQGKDRPSAEQQPDVRTYPQQEAAPVSAPTQQQSASPQAQPAPQQPVQQQYNPQVGYAKPEPAQKPGAPSYRKPLTGMPRYTNNDPYRETPQTTTEKDEKSQH